MNNKAAKILAKRKLKVFTIESASAGYILHRLSLSRYSGNVLLGGIVCYDLSVKTDLLKIPVNLIEKYSPESREITRHLIEYTQALYDADISAHDKKIKKSDKTRHNSNFFDELNHAKSYQT